MSKVLLVNNAVVVDRSHTFIEAQDFIEIGQDWKPVRKTLRVDGGGEVARASQASCNGADVLLGEDINLRLNARIVRSHGILAEAGCERVEEVFRVVLPEFPVKLDRVPFRVVLR